jgi:hypothetical protein
MLTGPGIPCLYYGTEAAVQDTSGKPGKDSETGRLTFVPEGRPENFNAIRKGGSFLTISAIAALRGKLPALTDGAFAPLWCDSQGAASDDGIFAFARYIPAVDGAPGEGIVVVVNAGDRASVTRANEHRMKLIADSGKPLIREGETLEALPIPGFTTPAQPGRIEWRDGIPEAGLLIPPQTLAIFRVRRLP